MGNTLLLFSHRQQLPAVQPNLPCPQLPTSPHLLSSHLPPCFPAFLGSWSRFMVMPVPTHLVCLRPEYLSNVQPSIQAQLSATSPWPIPWFAHPNLPFLKVLLPLGPPSTPPHLLSIYFVQFTVLGILQKIRHKITSLVEQT